jgi:glycosyltransferase involved in cell wall biosynthesis
MAMGAVPVVSSSLGDMIIESGTGAICSTGDSISLAQSINRILADPSKWYDMSRKASTWARQITCESRRQNIECGIGEIDLRERCSNVLPHWSKLG